MISFYVEDIWVKSFFLEYCHNYCQMAGFQNKVMYSNFTWSDKMHLKLETQLMRFAA